MNQEIEKIIRDIIRAVLQERGIEVVTNGSVNETGASTRETQNNVPRALSRFERASLLMEQGAAPQHASAQVAAASNGAAPIFSAANGITPNISAPSAVGAQPVPAPVTTPQDAPPLARVLAAVCCGECLSDEARGALNALEQNGFALSRASEGELKKRAPREAMIANHEVVVLPAVGDDDAAKMAAGIFDEPVTRTALAALATGVPVYIVLHAPYAEALRRGSPNLARVLENNRRALQTLGFNVVEASALNDTLRARFTSGVAASTRGAANDLARNANMTFGANLRGFNGAANDNARGGVATNFTTSTRGNAARGVADTNAQRNSGVALQNGAGRVLITAQDIDRAARSGEALQLPQNAIITPLARDRARELNFSLDF